MSSRLCFQVLDLIEGQTRKLDQRIDALLLVGGFAGSEYLKQRVEVWSRYPCPGLLRSTFLAGAIRVPNQSDCQTCRCRYSYSSWCCTIWFSTKATCFQCDCTTVLHHEGVVLSIMPRFPCDPIFFSGQASSRAGRLDEAPRIHQEQ